MSRRISSKEKLRRLKKAHQQGNLQPIIVGGLEPITGMTVTSGAAADGDVDLTVEQYQEWRVSKRLRETGDNAVMVTTIHWGTTVRMTKTEYERPAEKEPLPVRVISKVAQVISNVIGGKKSRKVKQSTQELSAVQQAVKGAPNEPAETSIHDKVRTVEQIIENSMTQDEINQDFRNAIGGRTVRVFRTGLPRQFT